MSKFSPIAVVGSGCILPDANSPESLWENIVAGKISIDDAPSGNWEVDLGRVLSDPALGSVPDRTWSQRGGFVKDFDATFDASRMELSNGFDPEIFTQLDPLFNWTLYAAHQAKQCLADVSKVSAERSGLILGNLSYPSRGHNWFTANKVLSPYFSDLGIEQAAVNPMNRFNSGLPAMLVAKALGLSGGAFSLDAACASGLYAIKLACDRLQSHQLDYALAGAVNAADPLFIYIGFCALNAMSRSGKSQPFSRAADGLVPSEGAAFVGLKRLDDAIAHGDSILGVIRGIGLSNDGRSGGFLSPAQGGQVRAMQQAFKQADLTPDQVSYIECHATGTPTGDATEISALAEVYSQDHSVALGSLKANLGHTITASGVSGLIKMLGALKHSVIPGTPINGPELDSIANNSFYVPKKACAWDAGQAKRVCAVSSFGFGGNNAHLLLEEWTQHSNETIATKAEPVERSKPVAVVAMSVKTHLSESCTDFAKQLFVVETAHPASEASNTTVALDPRKLAFPPNDLKRALGQQLLVLEAAIEALDNIENLDTERTGVYVGMGTDPESSFYSLRWRLHDLLSETTLDEEWLNACREILAQPPVSADVIGKMPNIPANRINNQFDLKAPGFTVSREELSGDVALELAISAINRGEIDSALVAAVDLSRHAVHSAAVKELLDKNFSQAADAAVVLVVKSCEQAEKDNDAIIALITEGNAENVDSASMLGIGTANDLVTSKIGHAHAASGLLQIAAGIELSKIAESDWLGVDKKYSNFVDASNSVHIRNFSFSGESASCYKIEALTISEILKPEIYPEIRCFSSDDSKNLLRNLRNRQEGDEGCQRIAIVGYPDSIEASIERAIELFEKGKLTDGWKHEGIYYRESKIAGELGFVFTGAASAYPKMGRELFLGLPDLGISLGKQLKRKKAIWEIIFNQDEKEASLPLQQMASATLMCQAHAELSRNILGLKPSAAIGLCAGESNALFAMGVWQDIEALYDEIKQSGLYSKELANEYAAVKEHWGLRGEDVHWNNVRIRAPMEDVRTEVAKEQHAYISIVYTHRDCTISGDADACNRILKNLNNPPSLTQENGPAIHTPAIMPFADNWRSLHTREVTPVPGVDIYSHYYGKPYDVSEESVAEALTGQATGTIEFPKVIEQAWDNGVRIFVEHGPKNSLTSAISDILKDRRHLACSLDIEKGDSIQRVFRVAAELWSAGVEVDLQSLRHSTKSSAYSPQSKMLNFDLRPAEVVLPPLPVLETGTDKAMTYVAPVTEIELPAARLLRKAPPLKRVTHAPVYAEQVAPIADPGFVRPEVSISAPTAQREEPAAQRDEPIAHREDSPVQRDAPAEELGTSPVDRTLAPMNSARELLLQSHTQLLAVHQEYLSLQDRTQRDFQALMGNMQQILLGETPVERLSPLVDIQREPRATETTNPTIKATAEKGTQNTSVKSQDLVPVDEQSTTSKQTKPLRVGPAFDRKELEHLSSGKISTLFGPLFEQQDQYDVQVRMPMPPLLLCDRVTGIEGEAGGLGTGTIWTESDVHEDSWYLHQGRMPAGIFIESGQADLLLISWLGIDFLNKGNRAYRLLGCELTFYGDLPKPGETLSYEIHVDGHAKQGDVRLFFFHYDCHIDGELRVSVRNGQAGFFTKDELAESAGVLWDASTAEYTAGSIVASAPLPTSKKSFSRSEVQAFVEGDIPACFGSEFFMANTHTRTPTISSSPISFLEEIVELDFSGGPHGRGYLRAEADVVEDAWFFDGHFKNDPCMPGTLMAEATLQTMAFYLTATGRTLQRDGWRFQPVNSAMYKFVCRGQVTPQSKHLTYELFVDEIIDGDFPTIFAHVLCSVDGKKAFLCERLGLQLVPDFPLNNMPLFNDWSEEVGVASIDNLKLDFKSLMHCAWGQPSKAFGPNLAYFDGPLRSPRLPGPPYHFMTRVVELDGKMGALKSGAAICAEYDIPSDAWYFEENGSPTMPFAVLMEIGLQPCGWLASFTLSEEKGRQQLLFRNLDGKSIQHREISPSDRTIVTRASLKSVSIAGDLILFSFKVECLVDQQLVFSMETGFGFFPPDAMVNQKGLPASEQERAVLTQASEFTKDFPPHNVGSKLNRLEVAKGSLLMLDQVTGYWPEGGKKGLGAIRGEKKVDSNDWFFKAHFFQDPVQPGSLGVEAILQLIQTMMLEMELEKGIPSPCFEPVAIGEETEWHYRGQVTPDKKMVVIDAEIVEIQNAESQVLVICEARLWVDSSKIYSVPRIGMRISTSPS